MEVIDIDQNPNKYIYNSTKLYKNGYPIDLDVDMISEELYNNAGNRSTFEEIMKKLEKNILNSDVAKKNTKEEKNKAHLYYSANDYNGRNLAFRTTLPEGELMKEPIYQSSIFHKKYTDVNANSKFYYPPKDKSIMEDNNHFQNQWTNRANKIVLDSQNIWGSRMKTPKSTMHYSPGFPSSPLSNNNYNPKMTSPGHQ